MGQGCACHTIVVIFHGVRVFKSGQCSLKCAPVCILWKPILVPKWQNEQECAIPKITKRIVDALVPWNHEHVFWYNEIRGFGVRVRPSARKTYIVKYHDRRRAVKVTIGAARCNLPGRR